MPDAGDALRWNCAHSIQRSPLFTERCPASGASLESLWRGCVVHRTDTGEPDASTNSRARGGVRLRHWRGGVNAGFRDGLSILFAGQGDRLPRRLFLPRLSAMPGLRVRPRRFLRHQSALRLRSAAAGSNLALTIPIWSAKSPVRLGVLTPRRPANFICQTNDRWRGSIKASRPVRQPTEGVSTRDRCL